METEDCCEILKNNLAQAEEFKVDYFLPKEKIERGNKELKSKNNSEAVRFYSEAIKLNPNEPIYFSNRSAAYYNLNNFAKALEDADQALCLKPEFLKAHYRKTASLYELDRLEEAQKAVELSKMFGEYSDIEKILLKIENELKLERILPISHPEIQKIQNMEKWLAQGKSSFGSLKICYYTENYRGVHAKKQIRANEVILMIPKSYLITLEMAQKTVISQKILKNNVELLSPKHTFLATFILREKNDPCSFWKPYLDLLPTNYNSMPLFFSDEELSLLEGSPFLLQVYDKKIDLKKDYEAIQEVAPEINEYTFEEFCWARMSASSRIFGIVINNAKTDAFVPYADMLNHKRPKQTNWSYSDDKGGFVIESNEDIEKGEPVYDSYGRKCNSRFLLNYGFIVEGNDANEVAVKVYFHENDKYIKMKETLMGQKMFPKSFRIMANLEENAVKDFFGFVRFVNSDNEDLPKLLKDQKRLSNDDSEEEQSNMSFRPQSTQHLSIKNEQKTLTSIKNLCLESLNQYKTTLEEDRKLLERDDLTYNQRNCLLLRSGEKEILNFFVIMAEKITPLFDLSLLEIKKIAQEKEYASYSSYISNTVFSLVKKNK